MAQISWETWWEMVRFFSLYNKNSSNSLVLMKNGGQDVH
jgi:hypothetical protein